MVWLEAAPFESLVGEAIDLIPEPFASKLDNVDIVVADEPSEAELTSAHVPPGSTLFGLYQGIPQTGRGAGYTFVMPDKITIYRGPILRACNDADAVRAHVTETVIHEIAHHFGISDERLDELGW
jgi:predicted Zn-dependent protease with MMP-like domain